MTPEEKSREVYPLVHSEDWDKEQELVAQQLDRRVAFVCGYETAKKDTIERACAWWERNLRYIISTPNVRETYLRDFKNDMEEEQ